MIRKTIEFVIYFVILGCVVIILPTTLFLKYLNLGFELADYNFFANVVLLITCSLVFFRRDKNIFGYLKFPPSTQFIRDFIIINFLIFSLQTLTSLISLRFTFTYSELQSFLDEFNSQGLLKFIIDANTGEFTPQSIFGLTGQVISIITIPFAEEIVFRMGFFVESLKTHGIFFSTIFTTILFGLVHIGVGGSSLSYVMILAGSTIFCFYTAKRKNVILPILSHLLFNAFTMWVGLITAAFIQLRFIY